MHLHGNRTGSLPELTSSRPHWKFPVAIQLVLIALHATLFYLLFFYGLAVFLGTGSAAVRLFKRFKSLRDLSIE